MAFDFNVQGVVSNTFADVYSPANGGDTSDSMLDASTGGYGSTPAGSGAPSSGSAVTATPSGGTPSFGGWNPFFVGIGAIVLFFLGWKFFHESGRDESEFAETKTGIHNVLFAGGSALLVVPAAKAVGQLSLNWFNWDPWKALVSYVLNA